MLFCHLLIFVKIVFFKFFPELPLESQTILTLSSMICAQTVCIGYWWCADFCQFFFKSFKNYHQSVSNNSKTCLKRPLKRRPNIGFKDRLLLHAGQKYCRMLQGEHSAILSAFIKLQFVIKIFVLSIFEWPH